MCILRVYYRVFICSFPRNIFSLFEAREREKKKSYVARALSVNLLPCQNLNKNKIVRDFFGGGGYITFPSYVPFACIFFIYTLYALYLPTETDRIQLKQFMKGAVDMKS